MQDYSSAQCELDLAAYTIDVKPPLVFDNGSLRYLVIRLLNRWANHEDIPEENTLEIQLTNERECCIQIEAVKITASACRSTDWHRFFESQLNQLVDLAMARVLFKEKQDILWIEPSSPGKIWLFFLMQKGDRDWLGHLAEVARPEYIDTSYSLMNTGEQGENLKAVFEEFRTWLPNDSFWSRNEKSSEKRMLTVKVNPRELWFLRFPLSAFCQLQYEGFAVYWDVEWIVTGKGFIQTSRERMRMCEELSNPQTVLKHSVVVVNTYESHKKNVSWSQGTELILCVFSILGNIDFPTGRISLRWYLNPSAEEINQLVLDRQTLYFFGDFEASRGQWQLGEGQPRSWEDGKLKSPTAPETTAAAVLTDYGGNSLSHIRLMRVFHCNSIFDAHQASHDGREPGDAHSIVRKLLDAGVQRVEGGMTMESYLDYVCSLIDLLCRPEQFKFILRLKCLELGREYHRLYERINNFLETCNRSAITP